MREVFWKSPHTRPEQALLPDDGFRELNELEDPLCPHPSDVDEARGLLVGTKPAPLPRLRAQTGCQSSFREDEPLVGHPILVPVLDHDPREDNGRGHIVTDKEGILLPRQL